MRRSYANGHWIITLLVAPFTSQAIHYILGRNPHQVVGLLELYPVTFFFSLAFSLPTFCIYLVAFYFLSKNDIQLMISKMVLIAISISGVLITASTLQGPMARDIAITYSITSLVVGLILKLKSENLALQDQGH